MKVRMLTWVAVLLASTTYAAASEPPARHDTWQDSDYQVLLTQGGGEHEALPLIIALHASGSTPEELAQAFIALPARARIILPRGPYPRPTGESWFPKGMDARPPSEQAALIAAAEVRLAAFIEHMQARYPSRGLPVLSGVSYGGDLSLLLILHQPAKYAGAYPVAARLLPEWLQSAVACGASCPPIHALHGRDDSTVPMAPTQAALEQLSARGREVSLRAYDHTGHDFTAAMQADLRAAIAARIDALADADKVQEITRPARK